MKSLFGLIFVLLCLLVSRSQATLRYVSQTGSGSYSTILSAYNASATGDTILIGPGNYNTEAQISANRRLTWIGPGWDLVNASAIQFNNGSNGSLFEGINCEINGTPLANNGSADSIVIRRCRLRSNNNEAVSLGSTGRIYFEDCILINNNNGFCFRVSSGAVVIRNTILASQFNSQFPSAIGGPNGNLEIYNSLILGFPAIFSVTGTLPVIAINNIVYDWSSSGTSTWGSYPFGSIFDYNASSVVTPPGTHALLLTANPFASYNPSGVYSDTSDFHLAEGSVCINAGHPNILDTDASVSDLGVYGGPLPLVAKGLPDYPWVTSMIINQTLIGTGDSIQVNSSGRIGPQY